MQLPKRKPTRLKDFDYSTNGAYFITICSHNRKCIFSNIVGEGLCALPKNNITKIGTEIQKSIEYINKTYTGVSIKKYIIMPNHIHMIVVLNYAGGHGGPPLQKIIGQIKSYTTHKYKDILFQRSFHDHIIRDENEYLKICNYIDINPLKWKEDCFYIE